MLKAVVFLAIVLCCQLLCLDAWVDVVDDEVVVGEHGAPAREDQLLCSETLHS